MKETIFSAIFSVILIVMATKFHPLLENDTQFELFDSNEFSMDMGHTEQTVAQSVTTVSKTRLPGRCEENSCQNGGICVSDVELHYCECKKKYFGPQCECKKGKYIKSKKDANINKSCLPAKKKRKTHTYTIVPVAEPVVKAKKPTKTTKLGTSKPNHTGNYMLFGIET